MFWGMILPVIARKKSIIQTDKCLILNGRPVTAVGTQNQKHFNW